MNDEQFFINPSDAHDVNLDKVFQRLDLGLTVNLIDTPRQFLRGCQTSTIVGPDLEHRDFEDFDFLPVFEGGEIVGLLDRVRALSRKAERGKRVADVMAACGEANLISGRSGVRDFIRTADVAPARLVIDGTRISGIVTIADIQKLPVRVAIFSLITHLELLMTEVLSNELGPDGDPFTYLNGKRAKDAWDRWMNLQREQVAIDQLTALELCDKRDLLAKFQPVDVGRDRIRRELGRIERLRNQIAHSGRYAGTRAEATKAIRAIQLAETWIQRLRIVAEPHRKSEEDVNSQAQR